MLLFALGSLLISVGAHINQHLEVAEATSPELPRLWCMGIMVSDRSKAKPADTRRFINVGLTFVHRLRRWTNVKPTWIQRLVSAGIASNNASML